MGEGPVIVFAGPSLPATPDDGWRDLLSRVELRPPARRGDLLATLSLRPRAIVLLDGYYFRVPSVSHKEVLYCLADGARVLGAASMGALRAAELASFGMEPVGEIACLFVRGELEGDDEVALLHREEPPHRALTEALVEVRATARTMVAEGRIPANAAAGLVAELKALPFWERTRGEIRRGAERQWGMGPAAELLRRLDSGSLKERDARLALERGLEPRRRELTPSPSRFTGYLEAFLEESVTVPVSGPGPVPSLRDAWGVARLLHPETPEFVLRERNRLARAAIARELGQAAEGAAVAAWADAREAGHRDRFGRPLLPRQEYRRAAELAILAEALERRPGWRSEAAPLLGCLPDEVDAALIDLSPIQQDLAPAFWLARAFAFTDSLAPAAETASAAGELRSLHEELRGLVAEEPLLALAAELWDVPRHRVAVTARSRALTPTAGLTDPLLEACRQVAVAERLPRPLNDYPHRREALLRSPLVQSPTRAVPVSA